MKRLKNIWLVPGLLLAAFVALAAWDVPPAPANMTVVHLNGGGGSTPASGSATMLAPANVAVITLSETETWEDVDLDSTYGSLPQPITGAILVAVAPDGSGSVSYTHLTLPTN